MGKDYFKPAQRAPNGTVTSSGLKNKSTNTAEKGIVLYKRKKLFLNINNIIISYATFFRSTFQLFPSLKLKKRKT